MMWMDLKERARKIFALLSVVFAALTSILAKVGISGLATGASWLCYYRALQIGEASKVVAIDKYRRDK